MFKPPIRARADALVVAVQGKTAIPQVQEHRVLVAVALNLIVELQ